MYGFKLKTYESSSEESICLQDLRTFTTVKNFLHNFVTAYVEYSSHNGSSKLKYEEQNHDWFHVFETGYTELVLTNNLQLLINNIKYTFIVRKIIYAV